VRETLLFAARMRLPRTLPLAQKEALVEGLLQKLNLVKVADTVVGGAKASVPAGL
jgi:ABC-type multidrug transport system ATPase subunit